MAITTKTGGVGSRRAQVYALDTTTGLPMPGTGITTAGTGYFLETFKSLAVSDPAPRRLNHVGGDRVYMQDSLPATEAMTATLTADARDMDFDAYIEGGLVVSVDTNVRARAINTDDKGNEPQVFLSCYRQALDADRNSATFGRLRQYEMVAVPSCRVTAQTQPFGDGLTDKTYEVTPTPVTKTPWGITFGTATWGNRDAQAIEINTQKHPIWNFWRGNTSIGTLTLSHAITGTAYVSFWVGGSLTAPSNLLNGTACGVPGITADVQIAALVQTDDPL